MSSSDVMEIRIGAPDGVLQVRVGRVAVDVPRSVGYFGGAALAVSAGLIEPPLGVFIAAVPVFKMLTDTALPLAVRFIGEILEGAAKPVGSDAEGVVKLVEQEDTEEKVITVPLTGNR